MKPPPPILETEKAASLPVPGLFTKREFLRAELSLPLEKMRPADEPTEGLAKAGRLVLGQGSGVRRLPVQVRRYANLSDRVCQFPKLELSWRERHPQGVRPRTVFLITHCNSEMEAAGILQSQTHTMAHQLAYRLQAAAGVAGLRTRPAKLLYHDPGRTQEVQGAGFFLEHFDGLARRMELLSVGALPAEERPQRYTELEPRALIRLHLFQILINNSDWRILDLSPLRRRFRSNRKQTGTHNAFVAQTKDGAFMAIPFDFDLSTFVGIPEGLRILVGETDGAYLVRVAHPRFLAGRPGLERWMMMRLFYVRSLYPGKELSAEIRAMAKKRSKLRAAISTGFSQKIRTRALEHLETFLRVVASADFWGAATLNQPTDLWPDHTKDAQALCTLPPGTPLQPLARQAHMVRVRLVQRLQVNTKPPKALCPEAWNHRPEGEGWVPANVFSSRPKAH